MSPAPPAAAGQASLHASLLRPALEAWRGVLDALFPARCAACGAFGPLDAPEALGCCAQCAANVQTLDEPLCPSCALPWPGAARADPAPERCASCTAAPPPWRRLHAAAIYGGSLQAVIGRFKFEGQSRLAGPLAELLLSRSSAPPDGRATRLVPVPLHIGRLRARGYDQAALLARRVARAWRLPLELGAVSRRRETAPQSGLGAAERRKNLIGAFVADEARVQGLHLLLLDDVVTTGATLTACTEALLQAGAASVDCVAIARALPHQEEA